MYKLRQYQEDAITAIKHDWSTGMTRTLLVLPTGCHDLSQGVLMADGSMKNVSEVEVGNNLVGDNGHPVQVLKIHKGKKQMYEIVPVKGKPFIVTEDHMLSLVQTNTNRNPKYPSQNKGGEIKDVTVKEYLTWAKWKKHTHKLYRAKEVFFTNQHQDFFIPPYMMGVLLGDGSLKGDIRITTANAEVKQEIDDFCSKHGYDYITRAAGQATTYHLRTKQLGVNGSDLHREIVSLGLRDKVCHNKFVPSVYKTACTEDRLEILAGLMDTDGSLTVNGYDYISKSKSLALDIAFICRSVGLAAYVSECFKSSQNRTKGLYYRVSISGECSKIPVRIGYKKCTARSQKKDVLRTGFTVKKLDVREYIGFTVSGNNRYLLDDFTVTHNCGKTVVFNTLAKEKSNQGNVLILAHREELMQQACDKYDGETGWIKANDTTIRPVTVGSVQTMSNREYPSELFKYIIVDEAHHAVSDSYQKLLQQFPNAYVLGCTATADRGDKRTLATYFDNIAYDYPLKQAVQEGYLSPIVARTVPLEIDMSEVKVSVGDFELTSIAQMLTPYLPKIADSIKEYAADRKTIVFMPLVKIAQEFRDILIDKGIDAREVNGNSTDRKEVLEWFHEAGKGSVLVNSMLLTEGYDEPSIDCVVVLRPTKVRGLYQQMVGRGTRTCDGKKDLLLLDFLWLCQRHNLCRPASLVCENEDDVKHVVKQTTANEIDLFGAVADAEEARRNALAEALRKQARKKERLVDPLTLFDVLDDMALADYSPSFAWEMEDATDKQINLLHNFGIDGEGLTKGYASLVLDKVLGRSNKKMATVKQIKLLKKFRYNPTNWTYDQASAKITALSRVGWCRWKLRD